MTRFPVDDQTRNAARIFLGLSYILVGQIVLGAVSGQWLWLVPGITLVGCGLLPAISVVCYRGPQRAPTWALVAGHFSIWMATGFDVLATLWHSPDPAPEANPLLSALVRARIPLPFVYAYFAALALGSSLILSMWWTAVLRHREAWLSAAWSLESSSFARFVKTATGGAALTWRQYYLPLSWAELPDAYFATIGYGVFVVLLATFAHVYAGLMWFEVVATSSIVVMLLVTAGLSVGLYLCWLRREFQTRQAAGDRIA